MIDQIKTMTKETAKLIAKLIIEVAEVAATRSQAITWNDENEVEEMDNVIKKMDFFLKEIENKLVELLTN